MEAEGENKPKEETTLTDKVGAAMATKVKNEVEA